jgi:hypothetical protein
MTANRCWYGKNQTLLCFFAKHSTTLLAYRQVKMPSMALSAEEAVAVQLEALRQNDSPWYCFPVFMPALTQCEILCSIKPSAVPTANITQHCTMVAGPIMDCRLCTFLAKALEGLIRHGKAGRSPSLDSRPVCRSASGDCTDPVSCIQL